MATKSNAPISPGAITIGHRRIVTRISNDCSVELRKIENYPPESIYATSKPETRYTLCERGNLFAQPCHRRISKKLYTHILCDLAIEFSVILDEWEEIMIDEDGHKQYVRKDN